MERFELSLVDFAGFVHQIYLHLLRTLIIPDHYMYTESIFQLSSVSSFKLKILLVFVRNVNVCGKRFDSRLRVLD